MGHAARLATVLLALVVPAAGHARCGDDPADAAAVAAVRSDIDAHCDCESFSTHGSYVRCAGDIIRAAALRGDLRDECKGTVRRCAARSVCGKPGHVTCCRTRADGGTSCSIKRSSVSCRAPSGGTACTGVYASCCDACSDHGCAMSTTTTTSTTTSTTAPPTCGDGACNGAETCATCCADCGTCPAVCGNGICEAGETFATCAADCQRSAVVTLPMVVSAGQLVACEVGTSLHMPSFDTSSCWSSLSATLGVDSTTLIGMLPAPCGGGSSPTLHSGDVVNVANGQNAPVLQAVANCVNQGIRDYTVAVVASTNACTGTATVVYFTTVHINSVTTSGPDSGIDATQTCPQCGDGFCSDGDTCSNCPADCGGCPATCP